MASSTILHIGDPKNPFDDLETGSQSCAINPLAACVLDESGHLFCPTKHLTSCVHSDAWFPYP